jgi:signal transduction histidine kinase
MTALGTLAGGIAHDLNNTLVPILALSKLVARELPADSSARGDLDTIIQAGSQARDLVHQILSFSRKQELVKQPIDLAGILNESLRMLRASIPSTIELQYDVKNVPPVLADVSQIHQIIINLVTNAAHAIGDRIGKITVSLSSEPLANDNGSGMVVLMVADTGCGMDDTTMRRIFEPFYTTKPVGVGTGLGLSVVHGIVTAHGGTIEVRSQQGVGSEFIVGLPCCEAGLGEVSAQWAVA